MDAFSGSRELFIFVPFLLYNCTGFPLLISHSAVEKKGSGTTVPCCYDLFDQEPLQGKKDGLSLISSDQDTDSRAPLMSRKGSSLLKKHIVSRRNLNRHFGKSLSKPFISSGSSECLPEQSVRHELVGQKVSLSDTRNSFCSSSQLNLRESDFLGNGDGKVHACMYSPLPCTSEILVRISRRLSEYVTQSMPNHSWSTPFHLVPPSGSTSVVVPQTSSNAAFIISVTASSLAGPFAGRTRAITFQPR